MPPSVHVVLRLGAIGGGAFSLKSLYNDIPSTYRSRTGETAWINTRSHAKKVLGIQGRLQDGDVNVPVTELSRIIYCVMRAPERFVTFAVHVDATIVGEDHQIFHTSCASPSWPPETTEQAMCMLRRVPNGPYRDFLHVVDVVKFFTGKERHASAQLVRDTPGLSWEKTTYTFQGQGSKSTLVAPYSSVIQLLRYLPLPWDLRVLMPAIETLCQFVRGQADQEKELLAVITHLHSEKGIVKKGVVYTVTSDKVQLVKVGLWTGSLKHLCVRYNAQYGGFIKLHAYSTDNVRASEKDAFNALKADGKSQGWELFDKTDLDGTCETVRRSALAYCRGKSRRVYIETAYDDLPVFKIDGNNVDNSEMRGLLTNAPFL